LRYIKHNQHTTHNTQNAKNTTTMPPSRRWLPAAPILEVSAIALHLMMDHDPRNTTMWFFNVKQTYSLLCPFIFMALTKVLAAKR
jgi:hypothetical protein